MIYPVIYKNSNDNHVVWKGIQKSTKLELPVALKNSQFLTITKTSEKVNLSTRINSLQMSWKELKCGLFQRERGIRLHFQDRAHHFQKSRLHFTTFLTGITSVVFNIQVNDNYLKSSDANELGYTFSTAAEKERLKEKFKLENLLPPEVISTKE